MADNDQFNIHELAKKWAQGKISPEEQALLEKWYAGFNDEDITLNSGRHASSEDLRAAMLAKINAGIDADKVPVRKMWNWPHIAAAASVLLAIGAGTYFLTQKPTPSLVANDVQPFSGKVILHTGHGQAIILEKSKIGTLTQAVSKSDSDALAYANTNVATIYDTLEVTAGGRPQRINLADGSEVIVNVASKFRFPENFRKGATQLELIEGEAYFTIKHELKSPVSVKAAGQTVEDIGTEFNINAYRNEPASRTTLVEGVLAVNKNKLTPGQQAMIADGQLTISIANLLQVTAWKDGYFRFNGEHIDAVMRELARWYNIDVKYEGKLTNVGFFLKIARAKPISEVLNALERTNKVRFKIEGRRITVLSKV